MLTCSGCMRHCLQSIIGDSAYFTASSRRLSTSNLSRRPLRRNYSTSYERSQAGRDRFGESSSTYSPERHRAERERSGKFEGRDAGLDRTQHEKRPGASARLVQRKQWLDSRGIRPPTKKESKKERTEAQIQQHLKYLNDPVKMADYVRKTLQTSGDFDFVQELVRAASKNDIHVVSWNHLIGYQMSKGRMNAAISTYNEMKKRAQTPDAYTYTTIFNGCVAHKESNNALPKVLTIYNSMFADNSKVKPNTIHMNCVLQMCAKAKNMDALFAIVAQFTEKGLKSPNNLSFSIILNAIRFNAAAGMRSILSPMEQRQNKRAAIASSREIWMEVVERWRKGDLWIDEELVASMGRLLLIGQEEDWDDIFSLIQQTMNIPRQIPKLGSPARQRMDPGSQGKEFHSRVSSREEQPDDNAQDGAASPDPKFEDITVPIAKAEGIAMYAKPGPNTLSLLLQAALQLRVKAPAVSYWNIFTKSLLLTPDAENYHAYLRVLRLARASNETVLLLQEMPKQDMAAKTFRIAMSCCDRDKRNPNAFANAGKILDIMQMALPQPDIPALTNYLDLAITGHDGKHKPDTTTTSSSSSSFTSPKIAQGKQILRALDRLNPSFINLKSMLQFGDAHSRNMNEHQRRDFTMEIMGLTRRMIAAYDYMMNYALVPRDMYQDLTKQRSKLAAFVTRHQHAKDKASLSGEDTVDGRIRPRSREPLKADEIESAKSYFKAALKKADQQESASLSRSRVGVY
ncbi:hypothetical protein LZ554_007042 [Drepanopeziza brunnea f. sp. 'monogermtubi']|nr:hypothetical protein LZ554_007042 [Drepanopeziza brunnea f. sp. 'monogermtubi']